MHPSPGVKRTFPHIPICGTKFPGVEQEAGVVLLVAFSGGSPPNGAPFIGAEHLVYGGAVLVSQGGRGCVTILLGICRESEEGKRMQEHYNFQDSFHFFIINNAFGTKMNMLCLGHILGSNKDATVIPFYLLYRHG